MSKATCSGHPGYIQLWRIFWNNQAYVRMCLFRASAASSDSWPIGRIAFLIMAAPWRNTLFSVGDIG